MISEDINILGGFLGRRDVSVLTAQELKKRYGFERADVFVLFGGSILCGGDVMAEAIKNRVAQHFVIVGGAGHTTESLRQRVHAEYPDIETEGLPEAEVFERYLSQCYNLHADFLECESTNCGNNITLLLKLLEEHNISFSSMILCQDASMQLRMSAGLRKYRPDAEIINYAAYHARVQEDADGTLAFGQKIHGMWDMDRYITLLMGEIPRLRDDAEGYGPAGKGYIAHVDIPEEVETAFRNLQTVYADHIRQANPAYASREERIRK